MLSQWASRLDEIRSRFGFLSKYSTNYRIFDTVSAARLLSPELRRRAQAGRAAHHDLRTIDELSESSTIDRVTGLCLRGYTSNQLLRDIDAVSMAHSLEVRVPYLDPVVVDAALSLPAESKLGDLTGLLKLGTNTYRETGAKRILIDVGRSLLPKDFDLQPKRGFHMPFEAWLRGPLKEVFCETVSEERIQKRGLLEWREALGIQRRFLGGHLTWAQPWLLMILELWCQEVLDKPHRQDRTVLPERPDEDYIR
jgi:asparagine synthase (glutamine-hydrolysing)